MLSKTMTEERYKEIANLVVCGASVTGATKSEAERKAFSRMRDKKFLYQPPPKSQNNQACAGESVPSVAEIEREMLFSLMAGLRSGNTTALKVAVDVLKLRDPKYSEKTQKFTEEDFRELWREVNQEGKATPGE